MDKILDVAAYVIERYKWQTGEAIDEMKLHKMLYFIQRESFARAGHPAFEGDFEGWKYGPVAPSVRAYFYEGQLMTSTNPVSDETEYYINCVVDQYCRIPSWELSKLSHNEISWKNARDGLKEGENGNRVMKLSDIEEDAKKVRIYDSLYDMYIDEFDDATEEEMQEWFKRLEEARIDEVEIA